MATPPAVDARRFRDWMGRWPTGVTVVTTSDGTVDAGLTVNAFLSVSVAPPAILVSLQHDVDSLPVLERSGRFAVSLLAADQRSLSERFARPSPLPEKFRDLAVHRGSEGNPIPDGTLGALECRVASITPVHDHRLVVGDVVRLEVGVDAPPLVFYHSGYAVPEADGRLRFPPPRG